MMMVNDDQVMNRDWKEEEDRMILELVKAWGTHWTMIQEVCTLE